MNTEKRLVEYISRTKFDDIPNAQIDLMKNIILTIIGATVAGATSEGCETMVGLIKEWGGKEEGTILIYGGKVPAHNAVLVNSTMARALSICDGMAPGINIGPSSVPTALAAAELAGGCSGREFLAALVLGTELAARLNSISVYDGFDPTGVCAIFATTVVAGKILQLNSVQLLDALGLAFNRSGGSLQSSIDGSMAPSVVQGFVSQGGIVCADLARRGITGPKNFFDGIYGYFHLYANNKHDDQALLGGLGERFEMTKTIFKSYPSAGGTIASTDAILALVGEKGLTPDDVTRIDIKVTPYIYRVVGHKFQIGDNPRANAQFSIQFCVANALLRKGSKLHHFGESLVKETALMELIKKIHVTADPNLDQGRPELICKADMKVTTKENQIYHKTVEIPSGFPENPLTRGELKQRFYDYIDYGSKTLAKKNIELLLVLVDRLEEVEDVRSFLPLLINQAYV